MIFAIIISALVILIGVLLLDIYYAYRVDDRLLELELKLDKQEVKLNHIISQLRELQNDIDLIDNNLHTIIGNINNLKEEQK